MVFGPSSYTLGSGMFGMEAESLLVMRGSRQATEVELALAEHQGKYMAVVVKKLAQA